MHIHKHNPIIYLRENIYTMDLTNSLTQTIRFWLHGGELESLEPQYELRNYKNSDVHLSHRRFIQACPEKFVVEPELWLQNALMVQGKGLAYLSQLTKAFKLADSTLCHVMYFNTRQ